MRVGSRLRRLVGSVSCPWRAALEFHRMTRGLGSATNSPELPKLPLSRKHRGQSTTNVTGTTPAMSYPLYVSDMVCKSPLGLRMQRF